ncbi:methylenetetrahydrofolate reductase [NAD(P)H] [Desulfomicrobium escambiense]|uniref:methylenetetrahydrofolate reductase [NAD(P)H] n=1 Tax=Desulfomicrobium escambiense TaxID=29503 RepID=UPI00041CD6CD|nr:methylenetetrahydrofolate reductase [NAD(P)H] [Desulfomicrobium escambiense]
MRIADLLRRQEPFLSLEFFPPKDRAQWPGFFDVVRQLKVLDPLFCSVTYGAGGSTQHNTLEIVTRMKQEYGLEPLAHLTCVGADRGRLGAFLQGLREAGVDNVLALRGDPPKGETEFRPDSDEFRHGNDLVCHIRSEFGSLSVGVAGYPEKHPEAVSPEADLEHLRRKVACGADFVITQLFFDNDHYFNFVDRAREAGIDVPIIPGVLPVQNLAALKRMLAFCGATVPAGYMRDLEHVQEVYGDSGVRGLGLGYARSQVRNLLDRGAPGVHLYTLNKADTCLEIWKDFAGRQGRR